MDLNGFTWVLREDSAMTQVVRTNALKASKSRETIE